MDVLSDVLRVVRLTGSVFFTANLFEPFSISSPGSEDLVHNLPVKVECVSLFHIITEGQCWFEPKGSEPFLLEKGSIVVFPNGCAHTMCSSMSESPQPLLRLLSFEDIKELSTLEYGGNGATTQFVCGYLFCDQRFNPLLGALPEVLVLTPKGKKSRDTQTWEHGLTIEPNSWLDMTRQYLVDEVQRKGLGSRTVVTRLTELFYVEILRRYLETLPVNSKGWLAGIRDPEIGKALRLLHEKPGYKWNVETLASRVGVSRSAFAQRFTELIGESPIRYLTTWRMQLAKRLLLKADLSIDMVADRVGYDSDISFNRAFRRYVGTPPATWRHEVLSTRS